MLSSCPGVTAESSGRKTLVSIRSISFLSQTSLLQALHILEWPVYEAPASSKELIGPEYISRHRENSSASQLKSASDVVIMSEDML